MAKVKSSSIFEIPQFFFGEVVVATVIVITSVIVRFSRVNLV